MPRSHWKFHLGAKNEKSAKTLFSRCLKLIGRPCLDPETALYSKGGYMAKCSFYHSDDLPWSEVVLEVISFSQQVGYGWLLIGDIHQDPSGVLSIKENLRASVSGLLWSEWQVKK